MKIVSSYGRDIDDKIMSQVLYMSTDAYAAYDALNADDGIFVVGAIPSITLKQFKRRFSSTLMILALEKSKLVGMACVTKHKKNLMYLHTVYVKPLKRRAGIGKRLVKKALDFAKKSKSSLMLDVNPLNSIAIDMYKSVGFKTCKEQTIKMEVHYSD